SRLSTRQLRHWCGEIPYPVGPSVRPTSRGHRRWQQPATQAALWLPFGRTTAPAEEHRACALRFPCFGRGQRARLDRVLILATCRPRRRVAHVASHTSV